MLDAYVAGLERELSKSLPPEDVRTRLAEAEAHLEDDVQARLELGATPEEAARDAVAAYGSPRRIARAVVVSDLARSVRLRLRLLVLFYAALAAYTVAVLMKWDIGPASFAVHFPLVGMAYGSFRSRRPAPVAILGVGLAVSFTLSFMFILAIRPEGYIFPRNPLEYVIYPVYTCVVDFVFGLLGALVHKLRPRREGDARA